MKLKITLEKVIFEERIIEVDNKFKICACTSNEELKKIPVALFDELAKAASEAVSRPLYGEADSEDDLEKGVIVAGVDIESDITIF